MRPTRPESNRGKFDSSFTLINPVSITKMTKNCETTDFIPAVRTARSIHQ